MDRTKRSTTTLSPYVSRQARIARRICWLLALLALHAPQAAAGQDTMALAMRGFRVPTAVPRVPMPEVPRFRGSAWELESSRLPVGAAGAPALGVASRGNGDLRDWVGCGLFLAIVLAVLGVVYPSVRGSSSVDRGPGGVAQNRPVTRSPPSRSGWVSTTIRGRTDR